MNILFSSLAKINSFEDHNIYADLLRALISKGHNVYAVCPSERRNGESTNVKAFGENKILTVKTFNIQKTNIVEKGIGTIAIKGQFLKAIKRHFCGVKFDLVLYPTPPITLYGVVKYIKRKYNAKTYLMLKDIFPQNAVDIGMMTTSGVKGLIYKYFRNQEKKLYAVSDKIGCMSAANVEYLINHNPSVSKDKIEVFPNCIEIQETNITEQEKKEIRVKYDIPLDKKVFVYGGNLGRPQDIPFIIKCLESQKNNEKAFFFIVGDGTEFGKLEQFSLESRQDNFKLLKRLPANEFDRVLFACDFGLIFLDYRFTIPNFPSRLLSYMQAKLPVIACTDDISDVGATIEEGKFGWWCNSNDVAAFGKLIEEAVNCRQPELKNNSFEYLKNNYNVSKIINKIEELF